MEYAVIKLGKLRRKGNLFKHINVGKIYALTMTGQLLVQSSSFRGKESVLPLSLSHGATQNAAAVTFKGMKLVARVELSSVVQSDPMRNSRKFRLEVRGGSEFIFEASSAEEAALWAKALIETIRILETVRIGSKVPMIPLRGVDRMLGEGWYTFANGRMALLKMNENGVWFIRKFGEYSDELIDEYIRDKEYKQRQRTMQFKDSLRVLEDELMESDTPPESKDDAARSFPATELDRCFEKQDQIDAEGVLRVLRSPKQLRARHRSHPCAIELLIS